MLEIAKTMRQDGLAGKKRKRTRYCVQGCVAALASAGALFKESAALFPVQGVVLHGKF